MSKINLDSLGISELRQLAGARGWSSLARVRKSELVDRLRERQEVPADAGRVDEATCERLATRFRLAREAGFSRADLAELLGYGMSRVHRIEVGSFVLDNEVKPLSTVLGMIETGVIQPPATEMETEQYGNGGEPTKAVLRSKLDRVKSTLGAAPTRGSAAQLREVINEALEIVE